MSALDAGRDPPRWPPSLRVVGAGLMLGLAAFAAVAALGGAAGERVHYYAGGAAPGAGGRAALPALGGARGGRAPPLAPPAPAARRLAGGDGSLQLFDHYPLWASKYSEELGQSVCVLTRAHGGLDQEARLLAHMMSVLVPNHPRLTMVLVDSGRGEHVARLLAVADKFNAYLGRPAVAVSRWDGAAARARFPAFSSDDLGYLALDLALDDVVAGRQPDGTTGASSACDFVVLSDSNNLYSMHFFPLLMRRLNEGADMVGAHWVSKHTWPDEALNSRTAQRIREAGDCGPLRSGRNVEIWAAEDFRVGCIDLGAVMLRRSVLVATKARLVLESFPNDRADGAHVSFGTADGHLFSRLHAHLGRRAAIIRRTLMFQH